MTRFVISDPGAAHSAKNAAAPGLPNQPDNYSERTSMVDRTQTYSGWYADRFAHFDGRAYSIDFAALDKFLGELVAREVAGELREQAGRHRTYAAAAHRAADEHGGGLDRAYAQWHREEAERLETRAAFLAGRSKR